MPEGTPAFKNMFREVRVLSDNWIVQNLNSALSTWSEKMAELWTLLTENPATFKGGGIWRIMVNINDALTALPMDYWCYFLQPEL